MASSYLFQTLDPLFFTDDKVSDEDSVEAENEFCQPSTLCMNSFLPCGSTNQLRLAPLRLNCLPARNSTHPKADPKQPNIVEEECEEPVDVDDVDQRLDFCELLPAELCVHIFSFLGIRDLGRCAQVSKLWKSISDDCYLWKLQYVKHSVWLDSQCPESKVEGDSSQCRTKRRRGCPRWRDHFNDKVRAVISQNWRHGRCSLLRLEGHRARITALKIETDHHRYQLASASWDCTIKLWRLASPSGSHGLGNGCVRTLRGHRSGVLCMEWKDDLLVSGSDDGDIRLWCLHEAQSCDENDDESVGVDSGDNCMAVLSNAHKGGVWCLHFAGNTLVSGGLDCAKVWDMRLECDKNDSIRYPIETLPESRGLRCIQVGKDLVVGAGGERDNVAKVYDLASCQLVSTLCGHSEPITCMQLGSCHVNPCLLPTSTPTTSSSIDNAEEEDDAILKDNPFLLATGSADATVKLWDIRIGGRAIRTLAGHTTGVTALMFAGNRLVSGASYDPCALIRVWSIKSGRCVVKFRNPESATSSSGIHTNASNPPAPRPMPQYAFPMVGPTMPMRRPTMLLRRWGTLDTFGGSGMLLQRNAEPAGMPLAALQFSMTRLCTAHDKAIHIRSFCT